MLASKLVDDVDPQHLLENYLKIAFKAGCDSMNVLNEVPENTIKPKSLYPIDVINLYNEVFGKKILPVPQRIDIVAGRISDGRKAKMNLQLSDFKLVFEFKKAESFKKEESWLDFETLCARKHFFKYLEQAKSKPINGLGQPVVKINTKLF